MHVVLVVLMAYVVLMILILLFVTLFKHHVRSKVQTMRLFHLWEEEMKD